MKKGLVSKLSYFCVTASLASFLVLSGCGSTDSGSPVPEQNINVPTYTFTSESGKAVTDAANFSEATINVKIINTKPAAGEKIQIVFTNASATSTQNYSVQVKINKEDIGDFTGTFNYKVYANSSTSNVTTSGNYTFAQFPATLAFNTTLTSSNSKIEITVPERKTFKLYITPLVPVESSQLNTAVVSTNAKFTKQSSISIN